MSVQLNHTIVSAHNKHESAAFMSDVLGVPVSPDDGPFTPIKLENDVTLDFMERSEFSPQHYAFLVDDATFDAAYQLMQDRGITIWADPDHQTEGEINTRWGGRGFYFRDLAGHNMELLTKV